MGVVALSAMHLKLVTRIIKQTRTGLEKTRTQVFLGTDFHSISKSGASRVLGSKTEWRTDGHSRILRKRYMFLTVVLGRSALSYLP